MTRNAGGRPVPESVRVRVGGLALRCVSWGKPVDPVVVLIHGAGAHAHWWDALVPHLLPGWRLLAPDLRGHGESDWAQPPYRIAHFADDLRGLLDAVAPGAVVLIGHSMGGRVAAMFAAHHPERVRGLAVLDTRVSGVDPERLQEFRGVDLRPGPRRIYPAREQALAAFRLIPSEPGVPAAVLAELAAHAVVELGPAQWALRFDRAILSVEEDRLADASPVLRRIRCPAIVMHGERSTVVNATEAAAAAAALADCPVHRFPGGHHFPLVQPQPVGAALRAFLRQVHRPGRRSP